MADDGLALASPVVAGHVAEAISKPAMTEQAVVESVARRHNPREQLYGENVWKTYRHIYPEP